MPTPRPGRVHAIGAIGVSNADFARGEFDAIPADLDVVRFPIRIRAVAELRRGAAGLVRDVTVTVGSANNIASEDPPLLTDDGGALDLWYESNDFAGVAARLGRDWLAGVTYSAFTSPNGDATADHEVAAAVRHTAPDFLGGFSPQLKVAVPVGQGDGAFAQLVVVAPEFTLFEGGNYPLSFSVPAVLGVGFADYYGEGTGITGYAGLAVFGGVPLAFVPSAYGAWTLTAGVQVLARAEALREAAAPFTDDDIFVPEATVALSFVY